MTLGNQISGIGLVIYKPFRRGGRLQPTTSAGYKWVMITHPADVHFRRKPPFELPPS
jgi:hypothetical protein